MENKDYNNIDKQIDRKIKELVKLTIRFDICGRIQRIKIKDKIYSIEYRVDEVKVKNG